MARPGCIRIRRHLSRLALLAAILRVFRAMPATADERAGELSIAVSDFSGAALQARGKLLSQANRFALEFSTSGEGVYAAKKLPFGTYELTIERPGFARFHSLVNIRTEIPVKVAVVLGVETRSESITVTEAGTVLDTTNTGTAYEIGKEAIQERLSSTPGRELIDLVQAQPGWVLESNGVLHPRGSEYDTQYVVDGIPILNNRSPGFASEQDIDDVQSGRFSSGAAALTRRPGTWERATSGDAMR